MPDDRIVTYTPSILGHARIRVRNHLNKVPFKKHRVSPNSELLLALDISLPHDILALVHPK